MPTPTANGQPLLAARIAEPESGRWWAELEVSGSEALSGAVTIEIDGVAWTGTVRSSAGDGGRTRAVVLGGADGLDGIVQDRQYQGSVTVGDAVADLLRGVGETLSAESDAASLAVPLPSWQRLRQPGIQALEAMTRALGLRWRVTRAGSVALLPAPSYPVTVLPGRVLSDDAAQEVVTVAVAAPTIEPGQSVEGHRVRRIEWTLTNESLRGALYYGASASYQTTEASSIWSAGLDAVQSDGTLDLIAASRYGLVGVPYYSGLPGVRVEPKPGASMLGGYAGGDPRAPVAFAARGTGGLKIGTVLATVAGPTAGVPGILLSLDLFAADAAGDALLVAALAAIASSAGALAAVPTTGLPLTITAAVQQ